MEPSMPVSNRVALVTGASRGIGRAIAIELARLGYSVMINYASNETAAKETQEAARAVAKDSAVMSLCGADISLKVDREKLLATTRTEFSRLDLLVNNA